MTGVPPRLVLAFDRYARPCVVVVLALGLVGVGLGASELSAAERTTVTDHENPQTVTLNVSSAATVTEDNGLFPRGTELVDRSAYLRTAAPNVTVVVATEATARTELRAEHAVSIRYDVVRGDEVHWSETRPVRASTEAAGAGRARSTATVSIPAVQERLDELRATVGSGARVSATLVVASAYETDRYEGELARDVDLQVGDRWYEVESATASEQRSDPSTRTVTVPADDGDARLLALAGGALLAVGVAGVVADRRFDVDDERTLRRRVHERRYADWISNGHLPASFDRRVVTMASLADLAELGIDRERRLIFDESRDAYAVFDGDVVYYYDAFWSEHDPLDE